MKIKSEKRMTFIILLVLSIVLAAIIIPLVILGNRDREKGYFPNYSNINVSEKDLNNEVKYKSIKEQFEKEYYFSKLAIINDFSNKDYSSAILKKMLWNFMFNFEMSNKKAFNYIDTDEGIYCMSKKKFLEAFEELYDVDITKDLDYLPGYYEYIFKKQDSYCMYFDNIAKDYDNEIKVAVERMAMIGTTITTDIYVYEYYSMGSDTDKNYISNLNNAISSNNYVLANDIVKNSLSGKVSHKQLQLIINSKGKYFKYKILSSKPLNY